MLRNLDVQALHTDYTAKGMRMGAVAGVVGKAVKGAIGGVLDNGDAIGSILGGVGAVQQAQASNKPQTAQFYDPWDPEACHPREGGDPG